MKNVDLVTMQRGVVIDMFNEEFEKVFNNIADDNVKPDAVREITIKLQIKPDKTRKTAATKVDVNSKLAPVKSSARPIVRLAPYRTFREIKQPESEFLLRSRIDDNNVPKLALYEADGGAWKISAIHGIAEYIALCRCTNHSLAAGNGGRFAGSTPARRIKRNGGHQNANNFYEVRT